MDVFVEVSGIALISDAFLLDDGETGDTVGRIGLHLEPGIGDFFITGGTDSVGMCTEGCQRPFNPPKFFHGEHLHGQGYGDLVLSGSPVYWVGKKFCLRGNWV